MELYNRKKFTILSLLMFSVIAWSQTDKDDWKKFRITGSIQSDILFPQKDSVIGAEDYKEWALTNTYVDVNLQSKYLVAGLRYEYLEHPLPGFETEFAGSGFPHLYVTGNFNKIKITLGDFYDQFGNGFIFRTYEERSLGIDNALRGARVVLQPLKGVNIKLLGGKQRYYFGHNDSYVWGADAELNIDQWSKKMQEADVFWTVGGSFVSRYQQEDTIITIQDNIQYRLNLPENVGAYSLRSTFQKGNYSFLAEYAWKANDPSKDNNYIYKPGNAIMLSGSYSKKGVSMLLQAKRSDNMSFRSVRTRTGLSSFVNNLPPFTTQQTYALAALYPYATQPDGEWAFQGEAAYVFKKHSLLGGSYGTTVKLNASHIRSIDKKLVADNANDRMGTYGYSSDFFNLGDETYYQDINFNIEKKISKEFKLNLMYMNQIYNQEVVLGHGDHIHSNIFIAEGKYQISPKLTLRSELQYLQTKQDKGDWMFGLVEVSILPSLMMTVSDMYNNGETDVHYYMASASYNYKAHRLQVGYGRTRAGYNCSGGVCRNVPASKGFQISYNFNF